ncbi:chitin-binding type-2 domain-containing protein [Trichonephila clavipes]|nr:chitin-binding type-2 domain-containing protein [Trichonephila clavipes]
MNALYIGFFVISTFIAVSSQQYRVKRYVGNGQRGNNDWNWKPNSQLKGSWPAMKGDASAPSRQTDSKTNREGKWTTEGWSSTDIQQKDEGDISWNTQSAQGNNKGSAYPEGDENPEGKLETLLRGVPGMDFPDFLAVPDTSFDCSSMPSRGYYGDVEAGCQVFHICQPGNRKDSFLCPVGTIFNQKHFVCDWWFNVNCSETMAYYGLNNEIYKDPVVQTDPPVTEKTLPWSSQDLDKKRQSTKSWAPQPPTAKQGMPRKDVATKRGAKGDTVSTTGEAWSHTGVQKEITVSWSTSGNYGSSSIASNSLASTAKPIWYGIDGQPAKDQSDAMRKRNGLALPFGTRMKQSSMATAGTWNPTEVFEPTTPPRKSSTFHSSTTRNWVGGENFPKTSIIPTGVKGVWEQETTKKTDQDMSPTVMGRRGIVTKSEGNSARQKNLSFQDHSRAWSQRQAVQTSSHDPMNVSASSSRAWHKHQSKLKRGERLRKKSSTSDINTISRKKNWQ